MREIALFVAFSVSLFSRVWGDTHKNALLVLAFVPRFFLSLSCPTTVFFFAVCPLLPPLLLRRKVATKQRGTRRRRGIKRKTEEEGGEGCSSRRRLRQKKTRRRRATVSLLPPRKLQERENTRDFEAAAAATYIIHAVHVSHTSTNKALPPPSPQNNTEAKTAIVFGREGPCIFVT